MGLFWFNDLATEQQLMTEVRARNLAFQAIRENVTPFMAENLIETAARHPSLSNSVLQAAAAVGIPANSPALPEIERRQAENTQQSWTNLFGKIFTVPVGVATGSLKIGVRSAFTFFDAAIDELVLRPFRTIVGTISQEIGNENDPLYQELKKDGLSIYDAYKLSGESIGIRAIREHFSGRGANIGSGFIPDSDIPEEIVTDYDKLVAAGVTPNKAYERLGGNKMKPITDIRHYEAGRLRFGGGQEISPGRVVASTVFQPGSIPYNMLSGLADATVQIAADPTGLALSKISRLSKSNKLIYPNGSAYVRRDGPISNFLGRWNPGLIRGARPSIMAQDASVYGPQQRGAGKLWDVMKNNVGDEGYIDNLELLSRGSPIPPPPKLIQRITDSRDAREIEALAMRFLGQGGRRKPTATSFLGRLVTGRDTSVGSFFGRMVGKTFGDADDAARGATLGFQYAIRNQFGQNHLGRIFSKMPSRLGMRVDKVGDMVKDGNSWLFQFGFDKATRGRIVRQLGDLRAGDAWGARRIMVKAADDLRATMVRNGLSDKVAQRATTMWNKEWEGLRHARAYWMDLHGNPINFPGAQMSFLPEMDEAGNLIAITAVTHPSAHTLLEHTSRFLPMPDPRKMRQAMSKFNKLFLNSTTGSQRMYLNALDGYMQRFWKPMVLSRIAWPVRVILEEQVRMAAAGHDSLFNHPLRWLGWVVAKPGKRVNGVLQPADDIAGGLIHRTGASADIEAGITYQQAHSLRNAQGHMGGIDKGVKGKRTSIMASPTFDGVHISQPGGREALSSQMFNMWFDDTAATLIHLTPASSSHASPEYVEWLMTGEGKAHRLKMAQEGQPARFLGEDGDPIDLLERGLAVEGNPDALLMNADDPEIARMLGIDPAEGEAWARMATQNYADSQWARFNGNAGGDYKVVPIGGDEVSPYAYIRNEYVVTTPGDTNLLQATVSGELKMPSGTKNLKIDELRRASTQQKLRPSDRVAELFKDGEAYGHVRPKHYLPRKVGGIIDEQAGIWDTAIQWIFSAAARLTDKFSRIPVYHQALWDEIEVLLPRMSPDLRARWIEEAKGANLPPATIARMEKAPIASTADPEILVFNELRIRTTGAETRVENLRGTPLTDDADARALGFEDSEEARQLADSDWREFSERTGYTPKEIEEYEEFMDIAREVDPSGELSVEATRDIDPHIDVADDIDDYDFTLDIASSVALHKTKDLLYDLSSKSNAADITRNFTPFAEAWWEILSTWSKLMTHNPQTLRRFQQVYEGAREADPFNTGNGFFHIDPQTGEEVFVYPLIGSMLGMVTGIGGGVGPFNPGVGPGGAVETPLELTGSLKGANLFAGSVLPGVGPVVQFPASFLIPDHPNADFLRDLILPFGEMDSISDVVGVGVLPAAVQKMVTGFGLGEDPNAARLQNNTTIELYRALILSGNYNVGAKDAEGNPDGVTIRKEFERAMGDAKRNSSWFTVIRGLVQFIVPSAPAPRYQVKIAEEISSEAAGQVFALQILADEYRKKLEEMGGDDQQVTEWFLNTYGLEPYILTTPKTRQIRRRSSTSFGDNYQRLNPDLYNSIAPLTASYAEPLSTEDFDYNAYLREIRERTRVPLTVEQWAQTRNQLVGRLRYQIEKDRPEVQALLKRRPEVARVYLKAQRAFLRQKYYGYDRTIENLPQRKGLDEIMEEFETVWFTDDRLRNSPAGSSVRYYMSLRAQAETYAKRRLDLVSFTSAQRAAPIRSWLREQADLLAQKNPEFLVLWRFVFERELINEEVNPQTMSTNPSPEEFALLGLDGGTIDL